MEVGVLRGTKGGESLYSSESGIDSDSSAVTDTFSTVSAEDEELVFLEHKDVKRRASLGEVMHRLPNPGCRRNSVCDQASLSKDMEDKLKIEVRAAVLGSAHIVIFGRGRYE